MTTTTSSILTARQLFAFFVRLTAVTSLCCFTAHEARSAPLTGPTGPGGFEPASVSSDLTLWLDADAITGVSGGNPLDTWSDRSGKGNNATQSGDRRPTFNTNQQNGRAAVNFDGAQGGTGDFMQLGTADLFDLSTSNGFSFFSMTQLTGFPGGGSSTFPVILSAKSGVTSQVQFLRSNNSSYDDFSIGSNSSTDVRANSADFQLSTYQFIGGSYNGSGVNTNTNFSIAVDGNTQTIISSGSFPANNSVPNSRIGVETTSRDDQLWVGDMAEVITFDRQLNAAEQTVVQNYLSSKYDVAFNAGASASDLYAGDTGGNGDYDLDVFGLAGVAGTTVTNAASAGLGFEITAGLDDGDSLLAGHDTKTNALVGNQSQRVWYLDNRLDGDEAIEVSFDFSDAGLTAPAGDFNFSYVLLFSATDGGPFAPLTTGNLTSDTVLFGGLTASQLADGYYTVAFTQIPEPSSGLMLAFGAVGLAFRRRRRK